MTEGGPPEAARSGAVRLPGPRLAMAEILAFAGLSLPLTGLGTIYGVYLAPYLTGVLGVKTRGAGRGRF